MSMADVVSLWYDSISAHFQSPGNMGKKDKVYVRYDGWVDPTLQTCARTLGLKERKLDPPAGI